MENLWTKKEKIIITTVYLVVMIAIWFGGHHLAYSLVDYHMTDDSFVYNAGTFIAVLFQFFITLAYLDLGMFKKSDS